MAISAEYKGTLKSPYKYTGGTTWGLNFELVTENSNLDTNSKDNSFVFNMKLGYTPSINNIVFTSFYDYIALFCVNSIEKPSGSAKEFENISEGRNRVPLPGTVVFGDHPQRTLTGTGSNFREGSGFIAAYNSGYSGVYPVEIGNTTYYNGRSWIRARRTNADDDLDMYVDQRVEFFFNQGEYSSWDEYKNAHGWSGNLNEEEKDNILEGWDDYRTGRFPNFLTKDGIEICWIRAVAYYDAIATYDHDRVDKTYVRQITDWLPIYFKDGRGQLTKDGLCDVKMTLVSKPSEPLLYGQNYTYVVKYETGNAFDELDNMKSINAGYQMKSGHKYPYRIAIDRNSWIYNDETGKYEITKNITLNATISGYMGLFNKSGSNDVTTFHTYISKDPISASVRTVNAQYRSDNIKFTPLTYQVIITDPADGNGETREDTYTIKGTIIVSYKIPASELTITLDGFTGTVSEIPGSNNLSFEITVTGLGEGTTTLRTLTLKSATDNDQIYFQDTKSDGWVIIERDPGVGIFFDTFDFQAYDDATKTNKFSQAYTITGTSDEPTENSIIYFNPDFATSWDLGITMRREINAAKPLRTSKMTLKIYTAGKKSLVLSREISGSPKESNGKWTQTFEKLTKLSVNNSSNYEAVLTVEAGFDPHPENLNVDEIEFFIAVQSTNKLSFGVSPANNTETDRLETEVTYTFTTNSFYHWNTVWGNKVKTIKYGADTGTLTSAKGIAYTDSLGANTFTFRMLDTAGRMVSVTRNYRRVKARPQPPELYPDDVPDRTPLNSYKFTGLVIPYSDDLQAFDIKSVILTNSAMGGNVTATLIKQNNSAKAVSDVEDHTYDAEIAESMKQTVTTRATSPYCRVNCPFDGLVTSEVVARKYTVEIGSPNRMKVLRAYENGIKIGETQLTSEYIDDEYDDIITCTVATDVPGRNEYYMELEDYSGIKVKSNKFYVTYIDRSGYKWEATWPKLAVGYNLITVTATQSDGQKTIKTIPIVKYVGLPELILTYPTGTTLELLNNNSFTVTGSATASSEDFPIDEVLVRGKQAKLTTVNNLTKNFSCLISGFIVGETFVDVVAKDKYGMEMTKTFKVIRHVITPEMEITKPEHTYEILANPTTSYTIEGTVKTSDAEYPCKKLTITVLTTTYNVSMTNVDSFNKRFSYKISNLRVGTNYISIKSYFGNSNVTLEGPEQVICLSRAGDGVDENDINTCFLEMGTIRLDTRTTLDYEGDIDTGIVIRISALMDEVRDIRINNLTNPDVESKIEIDTDKIRQLTGAAFQEGDDIIISTVKGNKYAKLYRDGEYTNVLGAIREGVDWFQLVPGKNTFEFTTKSRKEYVEILFTYRNTYAGI